MNESTDSYVQTQDKRKGALTLEHRLVKFMDDLRQNSRMVLNRWLVSSGKTGSGDGGLRSDGS
jgi:hypothetical protein